MLLVRCSNAEHIAQQMMTAANKKEMDEKC